MGFTDEELAKLSPRVREIIEKRNKDSPLIKIIHELMDEYNIVLHKSSLTLAELNTISDKNEMIEIFITLKMFYKENKGLYSKAFLMINKYGFRILPD